MSIKEYEKEYGHEVIIGQEHYLFYNDIGNTKNLLDSFNNLIKNTFGLFFDSVGGFYEPHVLVQNGEVCANVSVNQMPFLYDGNSVFYIQIGTVATKKEFRNKGLSRWLIEYILEKWEAKCDAIYLFANDSVLDFYPKFGFQSKSEFHCFSSLSGSQNMGAEKLQMNKDEHIRLVLEKYAHGNPFSRLSMMENDTLFSFYCMGILKDCVYYSSKYDVLIIAGIEDGELWCYDVFGDTCAGLEDILNEVVLEEKKKIFLGFMPKNMKKLVLEERKEKDTMLFVYCEETSSFIWDKMLFPIISHA